jgi:hypothetical protein
MFEDYSTHAYIVIAMIGFILAIWVAFIRLSPHLKNSASGTRFRYIGFGRGSAETNIDNV